MRELQQRHESSDCDEATSRVSAVRAVNGFMLTTDAVFDLTTENLRFPKDILDHGTYTLAEPHADPHVFVRKSG